MATFAAFAAALTLGAMFMDKRSGGEAAWVAAAGKSDNQRASAAGRITAISADPNGHFSAAALVNGIHVDMLADTGATLVVLNDGDAERIGIDPGWLDFNAPVRTANGTVMAARIVLDTVRVGGIEVRDVDALVAPPGALARSLLGMSFIGAISRFELSGSQLVLVQ